MDTSTPELRRFRITMRWLVLLAVVVVVFLAGRWAGVAEHSTADVTVMPCSAWADEQYPTIPDNTVPNVCVDERGTLHTAPSSK